MDQHVVRELIRRRLREHRLPLERAAGFRETRGDGRPCDACDEPIGPHERGVMVMVSLEWLSVRFHVDCYKAWEVERREQAPRDGEGRP